MVWFLAAHEWRVLKASTIVRLVIAVFAIALVVASALGSARAEAERATIAKFAVSVPHFQPAPGMIGDGANLGVRADFAANERGWLALLPMPVLYFSVSKPA